MLGLLGPRVILFDCQSNIHFRDIKLNHIDPEEVNDLIKANSIFETELHNMLMINIDFTLSVTAVF